VLAHRHHAGLIEAIEHRQGSRAESLAREHARIAIANLELFAAHVDMLERVPGGALIPRAQTPEPQPA
jgi:GntR family transcriptional regulator of vanillate catabolism